VKVVFTFFGLAFSALLPLINPLGDALVFLSVVGPAGPAVYRRLARRIALDTTVFLLVIEAGGAAVMKFFGISLPVMQVSGGLVLAAMGWNLLSQEEKPTPPQTNIRLENVDSATLDGKVFYPLTFPITAGPGCIVVMITLSAQASAVHGFGDLAAHAGITLAVVLLSAAVFICYGFAPVVAARVKPGTAHGIQRVIAFILLAIGVQITWNGFSTLWRASMIHIAG
jgi:multiple antibiotic resistance protein